jgi:hypothetical protein
VCRRVCGGGAVPCQRYRQDRTVQYLARAPCALWTSCGQRRPRIWGKQRRVPWCTTDHYPAALRAHHLLSLGFPPCQKRLPNFGMFLLHLSETLFAPDGLS